MDLLSRMSLEEKAAQMVGAWQDKSSLLIDEKGQFDIDKARKAFSTGLGLGQIGRLSDAGTDNFHPEDGLTPGKQAQLANDIQRFFIEESRLGIPVIVHEECLHGLAAVDATSFPQPIALAASFDEDLVTSVYEVAAVETRSRGAHQALTPVADVARDPRWGRVEETFGEDPHLVGAMSRAAVKGFQGDASFENLNHVIATLKHFAAHGQPESGMNCGPVNVSERELRDVFLQPFRTAIEDADAISVMASYNEIDGVPSHASRWLLREVLREEWGFRGFVVSDYYAIWELYDRAETHGHHIAADRREACALAVNAGVNIELPEADCYRNLIDLVKDGTLNESQLDELVHPMLFWKFKLGLFDKPYVDPEYAEQVSRRDNHRKLALKSAEDSMTLLQNNEGILPLQVERYDTIAVIGPNANRQLLGGYSGAPKRWSSVLDGIRDKVGTTSDVLYAEGCKITVGGSWSEDAVVLPDKATDERLIAEAVDLASRADVVVLAIGGNEQTSREAWGKEHMGDRSSLELFGRRNELIEALAATGKPIVALLFNGRPLAIPLLIEKAAAIVECWYLGQETGHAVANILFGDATPGGKLPISFPRSAGHLPAYYNYKPSARRGYLCDDVEPQFAFGYGLSYSTFTLSDIRVNKVSDRPGVYAELSVRITNTGTRPGSETVQLYVRDKVSSVTRPVKELKAFQRVRLQPKESAQFTFEVGTAQLAFHTIDKVYAVEPGDFDLMIGTSSRDCDLQTRTLTVDRLLADQQSGGSQ